MTDKINNLINQWLKWDKNEITRKEIEQLKENNNEKELLVRLEERIQFGTAGLRGAMRAGFSCMNDLTVTQASQGLCEYVIETIEQSKSKGIVIGYDGRHNSYIFAKITAATFKSKGFKVYLFSHIVPTPYVSFAVPNLKAAIGVMITASHNPKNDNGYKVYWETGCQINTPHDKGISKKIDENLEPWSNVDATSDIKYGNGDDGESMIDPLSVITELYNKNIKEYSVGSKIELANEPIVYTAMHGVGGVYAKKAFETFQLKPFIPVAQQIEPDAEFPTVTYPNPEEGKGALKLSIETAEANNSRLILANDPDADRLAVAEKLADGSWKVFNGNEIGVLLADWAWTNRSTLTKGGSTLENNKYLMINTAVSSAMLKTMSEKEGFIHQECLTGFKWIGNAAYNAINNNDGTTFLFGYEEAIGFQYGDVSFDKDGVRAAAIFAEFALSLYKKGSSVQDHLESMYKRYGYHISKNRYFFCYEPSKMVSIFNKIRNDGKYLTKLGDDDDEQFTITRIRDLTTGYDNGYPDCKARLPVSSSTQMITFYFKNGGIATLRGSGTEPKLKYYVEMIGEVKSNVESTLTKAVELVINQLLKPIENQLEPPKDD